MEAVIERTTKEDQRIAQASMTQIAGTYAGLPHDRNFVEINVETQNVLKIPKKSK
jgi:hypothetical protein